MLTKVFNTVEKMRTLILTEEATWEGIHALNGAKYLDNMSRKARQATINAYKKLFGRDLVMDMADSPCAGDDFFEETEQKTKRREINKYFIYLKKYLSKREELINFKINK